ncbi:winged helix-turn-helix domain-containing protein [Streptomyces sp. NBC_01142]|uniref:AfsR/SARP family transcriptional regulator n=1 Tax=Streptomyces sp. NBC_01142 TaxID=2975865 RepID=UPI00224EE0F3|nr:BTAD domain-containing putative transcriptional regulator [Streptomyces sp. NBC_01142]MCX4821371.1 winged helix-turn-helix domain-containing protein [Streptomyces sp. NBC_01142]
MLAALLLRGGRLVSHEQLIDGVWGDQPPPTGRRVLPSYVYALRRALDVPGAGRDRSVIRGGSGGYRFTAPVRLDTARLTELAMGTGGLLDAGDTSGALAAAEQGLRLFRGEPLAGLPGPYALGERQRLLIKRRSLQQQRLECLLQLGRGSEVLADLASPEAAHPLDEPVLALRIRALYGTGRQGEALAAYEGLRRRLREELGAAPSAALRDLHAAVLRHDDTAVLGGSATAGGSAFPDAAPASKASTAAASRRPRASPVSAQARPLRTVNELPGNAGKLIGRLAEVAALTAPALHDAVTVATVDGPAGVGKTSLLVHAAWTLRPQHPDGVLFLDLLTHHSPAGDRPLTKRLLQRLLRTLGTADADVPQDRDDLIAAWRDATSGLRLLLVLDDVGSAAQVRPLLPAGPGSHVLVAGRRRLTGLDADRCVTLEPLPTTDSIGLLRRLIGEARTDAAPEAVADLARLCGGLPLALRIAGARLQHRPSWSPAHLAARMAREERRLGELSAGDRSVEAAFHMSYEQLRPARQRAFRLLGHAPTPEFDAWTPAVMLGLGVDEAEIILEELYDASLVLQPGPGRYRLHDLVRVHARKLADALPEETAQARRQVLELYVQAGRLTGDDGRASDGDPQRFDSARDAARWLDKAGADLADVPRYAAAHGEDVLATQLAVALRDYFLHHDRYDEGRTALTTALRAAERSGDPALRVLTAVSLGLLDYQQGRHAPGGDWFRQALKCARENGDESMAALPLTGLAIQDYLQGRYDTVTATMDEVLPVLKRADDEWGVSLALALRSMSRFMQGEVLTSFADARAALAAAERNGRPIPVSQRLVSLADGHAALGDRAEARAVLLRSEALLREAGDALLLALTLTRLGSVAEDLAEAQLRHRQALALHAGISRRSEPHRTRLEMEIRRRLGQSYAAAGARARARREFRTALAVERAAEHPELQEKLRAALAEVDRE